MVRRVVGKIPALKVLLAHTPQMRRDYCGECSLKALRAVADVKLHEGDRALGADTLAQADAGRAPAGAVNAERWTRRPETRTT
jgi:D-3-phosphoglycerate dehydrogenase